MRVAFCRGEDGDWIGGSGGRLPVTVPDASAAAEGLEDYVVCPPRSRCPDRGAIGFDRTRDSCPRSSRLPWKRQLLVGVCEDYGTSPSPYLSLSGPPPLRHQMQARGSNPSQPGSVYGNPATQEHRDPVTVYEVAAPAT